MATIATAPPSPGSRRSACGDASRRRRGGRGRGPATCQSPSSRKAARAKSMPSSCSTTRLTSVVGPGRTFRPLPEWQTPTWADQPPLRPCSGRVRSGLTGRECDPAGRFRYVRCPCSDRSSTLPRRALAAGTAGLLALTLGSLGGCRRRPSARTRVREHRPRGARTDPRRQHLRLVRPRRAGLRRDLRRSAGQALAASRARASCATSTACSPSTPPTRAPSRRTLERPGRAYGRWEIRLRQRQYGHRHTPYRVLTELVPATEEGEGCGEQNIALNRFKMGDHAVNFYIRTRPDNLYQAPDAPQARAGPVAHLRRRGHPEADLLVRRLPRDPHRAPPRRAVRARSSRSGSRCRRSRASG